MQLTWIQSAILAFFLGTSFAIARDARAECGEGGEVSRNTTFTYKDTEVRVITEACPGFATLSTERRASTPHRKRQIDSCNTGCDIYCANLGAAATITTYDACVELSDAMESLAPDYFSAPAQTVTSFTYGSYECEFSYYNYDVVDYDVCYNDVGITGFNVALDCYGDYPISYTDGGYCESPEVADNDWLLEVYWP